MVSIPILQIGKLSQRDISNMHRATELLVSDGLGYDLLPCPYPHPPTPVYTVNKVTTIWISVCLTFLTYNCILEFDCILLNILPPTFDPDSFWTSVKAIWLWDSPQKYHYLEEAWM